MAAERPAHDGRAAEPRAQGAARARACRRLGRPGGDRELRPLAVALGRLVGLHAKALGHQPDDRGRARQRGGGLNHVRLRQQYVAQLGLRAATRLLAVLVHARGRAGDPQPQRRLSVSLHAGAVPGQAHGADPAVGQLPAAARGLPGQGPAAEPSGVGAGPRPPAPDRRERGVLDAPDDVSDDRHPGHESHRGARAAAARHGALPRRLGYVLRAARRPGGGAARRDGLCERGIRLS